MFRFVALFLSLSSFSVAADMSSCALTYSLQGWSFFYQEYRGNGFISCRNGQKAHVAIVSRGGGVSFGKSEINDGKGVISRVRSLNEVFGTYVFLDGHAGATRSVEGRIMTKGEVSLALSGFGRGFDLGVTVGTFSILPR